MAEDAHAGDMPPPLSAVEINQLLHDVAKDVSSRADALAKRADELDGEFEARAAAAGDDDDVSDDLRARLAELSQMGEELSVEFEKKLMDLDAMVMGRLAALRAVSEDVAATAASGVDAEGSGADAADMLD